MKINILIVDDNQEKIRKIFSVLLSMPAIQYDDVAVARDVNEAKRMLVDRFFDLLILDLSLPNTADQEPSSLAGLALLDEISEREILKTPGHIVGLSAYRDEIADATQRMCKELWSLVYFDLSSDEWSVSLKGKVDHIVRVKQMESSDEQFGVDVLWLCALENPELSSVLDLPIDWVAASHADRKVFHYSGSFEIDGVNISMCCASLPIMGPVATATYVSRLITEFRPGLLLMTGIMAGNSKYTNLGDVVVANPTWDWGSGKHMSQTASGEAFFSAAPYQESLEPNVSDIVARLRSDDVPIRRIQEQFKGSKPETILKIVEGPVASGASVVADADFFRNLMDQHRKLQGIDMEAHAFMYASRHCSAPRPIPIVMKSVSDFADEDKNDDFQAYCAHASAETGLLFIKSYFGAKKS